MITLAPAPAKATQAARPMRVLDHGNGGIEQLIAFAVEQGADWIALSFVQRPEDLDEPLTAQQVQRLGARRGEAPAEVLGGHARHARQRAARVLGAHALHGSTDRAEMTAPTSLRMGALLPSSQGLAAKGSVQSSPA